MANNLTVTAKLRTGSDSKRAQFPCVAGVVPGLDHEAQPHHRACIRGPAICEAAH